MKDNYLLKGLSKDNVKLFYGDEDRKDIFVRKTGIASTSNRLEKQLKLIKNWSCKSIKVPKLFDYGNDKYGNYFYEMEYINSPSWSHIINYATKKNINLSNSAILKLMIYLENSFNAQLIPDKEEALEKINYKLKLLHDFFNNVKHENFNLKIILIIKNFIKLTDRYKLRGKANRLNNTDYKIHGDLTLSNVLVSYEDLYFIDLNEHYLGKTILSDISKLFFDLDFCLSMKLENEIFELNISILNYIENFKKKLLDISLNYFNYFYSIKDALVIVEALRVLQYVDHDNSRLTNNIQHYIIEKYEKLVIEDILCQH